jgi:hypothetical protein
MLDASLVQDSRTISDSIVLLRTTASPISSPGRLLPEKEVWQKKVPEAMTFRACDKNISGNGAHSEL